MRQMFVNVAVDQVLYDFDKQYAYSIGDVQTEIIPGMRVLIPFGNGNKPRVAVVLNVTEQKPNAKRIKSIIRVLDEKPLLNEEMLKLALWLKERTFCTVFDAVKAMLPGGINYKMVLHYTVSGKIDNENIQDLFGDEKQIIDFLLSKGKYIEREKILNKLGFSSDSDILENLYKKGFLIRNYDTVRKIGDATLKMLRLSSKVSDNGSEVYKLTKKQQSVVDLISDVGTASLKEVCYFTGVTVAVPNSLIGKGVIESYEHEIMRYNYPASIKENNEEIILSQEQNNAYCGLIDLYEQEKSNVALLFGVTGSGKTNVYLKVIDKVVSDGKKVIVMVPEISLTPQTIRIFKSRYGDKIAVFHSALSMGERVDEHKRVIRNEVNIVIGTRSAVFAPLENIGLIVIDEEQEHTYKSEATPRFHAREVAKFRCVYNNALLLLASATPSVESFAMAESGRYAYYELGNRYGEATLPEVVCVDLNEEKTDFQKAFISQTLSDALIENFESKNQSIILLNRRGYNTFVACRQCKNIITCPSCSISMTYHSINNKLMCHYCGYSCDLIEKCPVCESDTIRYSGVGTQKIEGEILKILPQARILRMDADSTISRMAYEDNFERFGKGEYDIMVGTQMVSKGLDFENVTLVGIISADQQLFNDDYKSTERTFSLLTQVIGRAGRGKHKGKAIIQTFNPQNETIYYAKNQDYLNFYKNEIRIRKLMIYPPFCDICVIGFTGNDEKKVRQISKLFFDRIVENSKSRYEDLKLIILGPVPLKIYKVSNKFRYRIIIKCHNNVTFREMISGLLISFEKEKKFSGVSIYADINPETIL